MDPVESHCCEWLRSEVILLGWDSLKHKYRLGSKSVEGSPIGKNFRVLVDEKLNVSQKLPDDKKEIRPAISHAVYSFFQLDNWSYRTI